MDPATGEAGAGHDRLREQVLAVVRDAVDAAGVEERCSVDVDEGSFGEGAPTIVSLRPAKTRATTLRVQLDHDTQITFYVGRHGTVAEDFNKDRDELLAAVRSFTLLAISGNYHEYIKDMDGPGHKAISRFTWPDDGSPGGFSYNVLVPRRWSKLASKGWTEETYEPY